MQKTEEYGFATQKGGFTVYDGVIGCGKEISSVSVSRKSSRREADFHFADGYHYRLSADYRKDGNLEILENIIEEWGEENQHS